MHGNLTLEEFEVTSSLSQRIKSGGEEGLAKVRSAAFEEGYQAGWDDAVRAETANQSNVSTEFAKNLLDIGFSFHEARTQIMRALRPLLMEIISKVVPHSMSETIGHSVLEELTPIIDSAANQPIRILVSIDNIAAINAVLAAEISMPLDVVEEPTFSSGQVQIRCGSVERCLDFSKAISRISDVVEAVYELNQKAISNG